MPECERCGADDFECVDDIYYCTSCNTLSQNFGYSTTVVDNGQPVNYANKFVRKSENTKKKTKIDLGRPWKTHEAFQYILRGQVNALIELGVDSKLEDIVFRLWISFLQKCGIAFQNEQPSKDKLRYRRIILRQRDKFLGTLENPAQQAISLKIAFRNHRHKALYEKESEENLHGKKKTVCNPTDSDFLMKIEKQDRKMRKSLLTGEVTYDDDGFPVVKEDHRIGPVKQTVQQQKILLIKTIGLVYIGLQYTDSNILPHDLVRWIKEDKIPYNRAELPEDMKFFANDYQTFCSADIPTPNKLACEAAKLVTFLGLPELPEVNITSIVHRFILELGLPGEMHSLVSNLIQMRSINVSLCKLNSSYKTGNINFACLAMAYIIIVLKLVFGLNDVTEWKLSKYSEVLSSYIECDQALFVWSEWVSYVEQQVSLERGRWFPDDIRDIRNVRNVDMAFHHFDSQRGKSVRYSTGSSDYSKCRIQMRKDISACFKILNKKRKLLNEKKKTSDSLGNYFDGDSYDEGSEHEGEDEEWNENQYEDLDENNDEVTQSYQRQLFQSSTIQHIIQPEEFLKNLFQDSCSLTSRLESQPFDKLLLSNDCEACDSDIDPSQDLFEERSLKTKSYPKGNVDPPRKCYRLKRTDTTFQEIIDSLPLSVEDIQTIAEKYTLFEIPDWREKDVKSETIEEEYQPEVSTRHHSYESLLHICSTLIDESVSKLEDYVQRLELVLITDGNKLTKSEEVIKIRFIAKCFKKTRHD